jgi:hypothetical protein
MNKIVAAVIAATFFAAPFAHAELVDIPDPDEKALSELKPTCGGYCVDPRPVLQSQQRQAG